ncbi:hypothetical protein [Tropicimonas isoalkanivorans]|uniref:Uncharacterized protein n=1 Tax=Tropicimonas isoalkanivorans TaxID=441112 RepID=A0A1I1GET5_9RHOB|nr:hypothetical protein [Tropicimonas isoalkanivorans]SFC09792.1 hypothetical protein SAMN04488094_102529 [Tropicimonas isoalkanivorans]
MAVVIWIGAAISLLGLAGIIGCVITVVRGRRQGLDDAAMRARLQKVVAWNLGSLMTSAVGLAMVVVGVILS